MSLSTNHIVAGLPAWATDEEAAEAASALGIETSYQDVSNDNLMLMARREEWKQIRAAAIVGRSQAIRAKAWALADQLAEIISDTDRYLDVAVAAVFGLEIPAVPKKGENRLYDALRGMGHISAEAVKAAAYANREHDESRRSAAKQRKEKEREQRTAAIREERKTADAEIRSELPAVGEIITVDVSYRLAKNTSGIAPVPGVLSAFIAVPGIVDKGTYQVRVTGTTNRRSYGKKIYLEGELFNINQ